MIRRVLAPLFFVFSLVFAACASLQAASLKVNIGELLLQNLQPGQTYDLKDLLNLPYRVEYDGVAESYIVITPSGYQEEADKKPGYELVPDLNWISVSS